jgi:phosphate-selective porin OprO/OprP
MKNNQMAPICWLERLFGSATCALILGLFLLCCLLKPVALAASSPSQTDDSDAKPIRDLAKEGITTPASHWHIYYKDGLHIESARKYLRMKVNALLMIDGGYIGADDELSEAFPGLEGWKAELRRLELSMLGWISDFVDFKLQIDFANVKAIKDNWIGFKVPLLGHIKAGNMKEPFSLSELTSSKFITFMERPLPTLAFAPGRNIGIMAHNSIMKSRMTWAAGGFWSTGSTSKVGEARDAVSQSNGYNLTARITGLPLYEEQGRRLLHLGLSYSHQFRGDIGSDPEVELRPRPETFLTNDRLVSTGTFDPDSVDLINPEMAYVAGPLSLQGEYFLDINHAPSLGNPRFWGFYLFGSYFLTGESRAYHKSIGAFSKVDPIQNFHFGQSGWGAWELGLRFSFVDLDDGNISGGKESNLTAGLNWYLNSTTRFMFNYVHAKVKDRLNPPAIGAGRANILQGRFQIEF